MRLNVLKIIYLLMVFSITARLFYWQVTRSEDLSVLADQQHLVSSKLDAPRGIILAKDQSILVSNQPSYTLFGLPKVVGDSSKASLELAKMIATIDLKPEEKVDPNLVLTVQQTLAKKLAEKNLNWVLLYKGINQDLKERIEKLKLEGVGFEKTSARFYPEASMSSHILGFVADDPLGRQVGYFGLEGYYNRQLQGVAGNQTEEKDADGLPILAGKFLKRDAVEGHDLILNIDRSVQYIVEKQLKLSMEKYKAKSGSVVIMDPKTGAVVSMASVPNYDPSKLADFPKENFRNPVVADSFEPGSTFKVLVMAAALNEGVVKPEMKCDICGAPVTIGEYSIKTWNNKYYQDTTLTDVIIHSDNTGMVFTARKLGLDKMYQYLENFGIGKSSGIDLQDESTPTLRSKKDWHEIDLATASFGQGIATTPIQMVKAVSAIANGGKLMEPHIVGLIKDKKETKIIQPKVITEVIKPETAKLVTEMMIKAVDLGEAQFYKKKAGLEKYQIAGKTGTAQIPVAGHYDPTKTVASFVGFAPANDPKFVMFVSFTEPQSSIFGADTAAPTFFNIAGELFSYYGIPPQN